MIRNHKYIHLPIKKYIYNFIHSRNITIVMRHNKAYKYYSITYNQEDKMVNYLDLTNHKEKKIIPLSDKFRGKDPHGNEISFTNY